MKKITKKNELVIYQAKDGAIELRGDFGNETIWATQAQITEIFDIDRTVVTKHIGNVLQSKEVHEKSSVQKMHIANSDKPVTLYSLDIILAVGYRANSARAIEFRKWATKTLRQHITKGYTINPKVIKHHYAEFKKVVENLKYFLPAGTPIDHESVLELISAFANTWLSLEAYDRDALPKGKLTKKKVDLTAEKIAKDLAEFRNILIEQDKATDFFGVERKNGAVEGIIGNVMQSFGGKELYASVEEKAAHLLYFMVKNHPFTDGNKRSGAFAFVLFLKQAHMLDISTLTPSALTALPFSLRAVTQKTRKNYRFDTQPYRKNIVIRSCFRHSHILQNVRMLENGAILGICFLYTFGQRSNMKA